MSSLQQQSSELLLISPSNNNNDNIESNNDRNDVTSDNNSDSDDGSEECLKEMLGGISFELDDVGGWKEEEEENDEKIPKIIPGLVDPSRFKKNNQSTTTSTNKKKYYYPFGNNNDDHTSTATITSKKASSSIYQNVMCSNNVSTTSETNTMDGGLLPQQSTTYNKDNNIVPVEIVDMGMNNRGNGLIATQPILKGSVIYTERAYIATQINNKDVLACQYCYRSLEPITKLLSSSSSFSSSSQSKSKNLSLLLPCPERWPILPLDFDNNNNINHNNNDDDHTSSVNSNNKNMIVDKYGRIQCRCCRSLFCCHECCTNFNNEYGSCCLLNGWFQKLETMLNNNNNNDDDEEEEEDQEEENVVYDIQQASIISLASQLFFQLTQHYRRRHNKSIADDNPILNFCGISSNINDLQLGRPIKKFDNNNNSMDDNNNNRNGNNNSNNNYYYSLSYVYKALCDTLRLTSTESEILSLDLFEGLACKAARNGFEIKTQSPFKPYYSSLLRQNYGSRDTPQHQARMEQISQAILGGGQQQQQPPPDDESGDQSHHHRHHHQQQPRRRDMDRIIEEKVAPTIASMFLLTAKLNHSCQPNAQVRCQEFVDAYIDIVASQNIDIGEEITISYIGSGSANVGVGKKSTIKRQRELQSKYLFVCDCPLCLCN